MRLTAVWGKWEGGWIHVASDRTPVIEAQQDHAGDLAEVAHKIEQELYTYRDGQTEISVGVEVPDGGAVPGIDWTAGYEVDVDGATREVEALAMTLRDPAGIWGDVPRFGTILDTPDDRIIRNFRAIGGLNGGTSRLTRPAQIAPPPNLRP